MTEEGARLDLQMARVWGAFRAPVRLPVDGGIGAEIKLAEIAPCAKHRCSNCYGRGWARRNGAPVPCGCAMQRFLEQNLSRLCVSGVTGNLHWRTEA